MWSYITLPGIYFASKPYYANALSLFRELTLGSETGVFRCHGGTESMEQSSRHTAKTEH